jgi:hypothetical protein
MRLKAKLLGERREITGGSRERRCWWLWAGECVMHIVGGECTSFDGCRWTGLFARHTGIVAVVLDVSGSAAGHRGRRLANREGDWFHAMVVNHRFDPDVGVRKARNHRFFLQGHRT